MLKQLANTLFSASLLTCLAMPVAANQGGQWFAGASYLNSTLFPRMNDVTITRKENIGKGATAYLGYDFDERSSGQVQLYSLGETIFSNDAIVSFAAADASLLYRFIDTRDNGLGSITGTSFYARFGIGMLARDTEVDLSTDSGDSVYFGAGAGIETYISPTLAVRAEVNYHDADAISAHIGLVSRFGGRQYRPRTPANNGNTRPSVAVGRTPNSSANGSITASPTVKPQALPIEPVGSSQNPTNNRPSNQGSRNGTPVVPKVNVVGSQSELDDPALDRRRQQANQTRPVQAPGAVTAPSRTQRPVATPPRLPTQPQQPVQRNPSTQTQLERPQAVTPPARQQQQRPDSSTGQTAPDSTQLAELALPNVQSDSDGDGVFDEDDRCRNSSANSPVDDTGCSIFARIASQIKFKANSPLPEPSTEQALARLAATLIEYPNSRIELIAHTDSRGNPPAETLLTRQRLRAIGIYLMQRGIRQDRLLLRSFGSKRPAFDNGTAQGRLANNRIVIVEKS